MSAKVPKVENHITVLGEAENILFHERMKAAIIAGIQLHRKEVCTWQDLYDHTRLKKLGVSQHTLASILKAWINDGIVKKERAPFPWRTKYRLLKREPYLELLEKATERIRDKHNLQTILKHHELDIEGLKEIGREAVQEWEAISKATFLALLWMGFEGAYPEVSPSKVALAGFAIVDYLFHAVAHLSYEAREEAQRILEEQIGERPLEKKEVLQESIFVRMR